MKLLFLLIVLFASCTEQRQPVGMLDGTVYYTWDTYYDAKLSKMKSPVVLIGKESNFGSWGVTVKDSTGEILSIGNLVSTANNIGNSRNIGDTIK